MEDEDEVFFDTAEDLCRWKTGTRFTTLDDARSALEDNEEENDCWMSLHECWVIEE